MARESWIPGAYPSIGNAPWVCYPALRGQCYAVEKHAGQRRLHLLMDHPDVKELLAKESQLRMEEELSQVYRAAVAAMEEGLTSIYDPGWFADRDSAVEPNGLGTGGIWFYRRPYDNLNQ